MKSIQSMSSIQSAIAAQNAPDLQRAAHTLKSSVDLFGAKRAYETARKLERLGRNEELSEARKIFATPKEEVEQVIAALKTQLV